MRVGLLPLQEGKVCHAEAHCGAVFPRQVPTDFVVCVAYFSGQGLASDKRREAFLGHLSRYALMPLHFEENGQKGLQGPINRAERAGKGNCEVPAENTMAFAGNVARSGLMP